MARDKQPWNTLGYAEKCLVAAKSSLNASALSSEGSSVKLMDCGIDSMRISTLGEYLANKKRTEAAEIDNDKIEGFREDSKLARVFVVPVILPNGQEIEVIVNSKGQDMACMYKDEAGNEKEFQLTTRMKEQIEKGINNAPEGLEAIVGKEFLEEVKEEIQTEYSPNMEIINVEDFAEKVSKDELVPGKKQIIDKVNEKNGVKSEVEENNKEIPAEKRDIISKICSENGLDINKLKEVMEVPPKAISENLEGTGFTENNGMVISLRFKGEGSSLQGQVVMAQGEKVINERKYDSYMNDYMNEHKDTKKVKTIEDEHDQLVYVDLDGNVTVCEIEKEPRDLTCSEKEFLQDEMRKLDDSTKKILNSDMPLEQKTKEIIKINTKRLDLLDEHGISASLVENEIEADIEISEEVGAIAAEEAEEEEITEEKAQEEPESDEPEAFEVPGKRVH